MTHRNFEHISPAVCRTLLVLRKVFYNAIVGFVAGLLVTMFFALIANGLEFVAVFVGALTIISGLIASVAFLVRLILFVFFVSQYSLGWLLILFLITNALIAGVVAAPMPFAVAAGLGLIVWACFWLTLTIIEFPTTGELEDVLGRRESNPGATR